MKNKIKFYLSVLSLLFCIIYAQPKIPDLNSTGNFANDFTGTISQNNLSEIEQSLRKFNSETSTQIVFLMINTTEDYPIEMLSYDIAAANKIGGKENNNGILFLVAKNDRNMRIEVGYGLEGALPDATCNSIIRNEVAPHFKNEDYNAGVVAGLNAIMAATRGEYKAKDTEKKNGGSLKFWIILIILLLFFIMPKIGGRRRIGSGISYYGGGLGGLGGGFGGFGGSGGGSSFGGGGFGGFSGGGGSFGGGGSSGSW